mmetsp:Transcript_7547/g.17268  ORF Transcript_7547/g.17268 Transcript_7547/m.17268 type:complete len:514 (+) Transcript_7547:1-1542(+)
MGSRFVRPKRRVRFPVRVGIIIGLFVLVSALQTGFNYLGIKPPAGSTHHTGRAVLEAEEENGDCFTFTKFHGESTPGFVAFYLFLTLYTFLGLAIICDDYFVDSLEAISEKLKLSPDVAGATFMAAGSSAPELFTSVADSFFTRADIGSGTIVGSAVFNLVVIPGLSAALGGKPLDLDWRPLARDSTFYFLSIVELSVFIYTDSRVDWWEACILLGTYVAYVTWMAFNENMVQRLCPRPYDTQLKDEHERRLSGEADTSVMMHRLSIQDVIHRLSGNEGEKRSSRNNSTEDGVEGAADVEDVAPAGAEEEEEPDKWTCPPTWKARILWAFSLPYYAAFKYTVPDLKDESKKKFFVITFVSSVIWIGFLTWVMVAMVGEIGCVEGWDPALMGIVLLAAGTSVPDTIASVIVAKAGEGDMAVSNAIGSNVFDILLGLGLPWLLSFLVYGEPVPTKPGEGLGTVMFAVMQLLLILFLTIGIIAFNKFRLTPRLGYGLFVLYIAYVAMNIIWNVVHR